MLGARLADRYEVAAEIGRGGMGVVYRARDPLLDRDVAVKIVGAPMLDHEMEERFVREARIVAKMDHPSIVSIFDLGKHEGRLFFVMPLVQGKTLRDLIDARALRLDEILDIAGQTAMALEYSHARGVVHRDVKPENILVERADGAVRVRVTDFGLASDRAQRRLTQDGTVLGTVCYLSPEQVRGEPLDARSDVYALGAVLYECVAGRPPFTGNVQAVLYRIVHEFPALLDARGESSVNLSALVMRCLEKAPERRPRTAGELAAALIDLRSRLDEEQRVVLVSDTVRVARPEPAATPLVARERELGELQRRLNAAVAGEAQLVLLGGEEGVGKTRLVEEIERLARARGIRALRGSFAEQHHTVPYQGFGELLQAYFHEASLHRLETPLPDFSDLASDLGALFPALADVSALRERTADNVSGPPRVHSASDRRYVFEVLARSITRLGAGRPLVLLLEDLHDARASAEALQYIVPRIGSTPTLILGTYNDRVIDRGHPLTRLIDAFKDSRRFAQVSLSPLGPEAHRKLVESLLGARQVDPALVERLYEVSDGNPYFTREIVHALVESRAITKDGSGSWTMNAELDLAVGALPTTLQQAVERRLDGLAEPVRRALAAASVLGRTFDLRELEALVADEGLLDALDMLVERGFLEEVRASHGDAFAFTSGVVRDVLYAGVPRRRKRGLHEKAGEAIEKRAAGRLDRVYGALLFHYARGDRPDKAIDYGMRSVRHAMATLAYEDVVRDARTVLGIVSDEGEVNVPVEAEAHLLLGRALMRVGDIDGSMKEVGRAIELRRKLSDDLSAVTTIAEGVELAWNARRIADARRWLEPGLALSRALGEVAQREKLLTLGTAIANLAGRGDLASAYRTELATLGRRGDTSRKHGAITLGGRIVVAFASEAVAREPKDIWLDAEGEILANVHETLLTTDVHGQLSPSLCAEVETQDGGATFALALLPDVTVHDGSKLTADDVRVSFERTARGREDALPPALAVIRGARAFARGEAAAISGLTVLDALRLRVELIEPTPIFPALLTDMRTAIACVRGDRVVGTGPFRLETADASGYGLRRFDQSRESRARVESIEVRVGLAATEIARELRAGEVNVSGDLAPREVDDLLRDRRLAHQLVECPKKNVAFLLFATSPERGVSASLRAAIAAVVRPRELAWQHIGRFAQPAEGLNPAGILGHDAGRRRRPLPIEEANGILASSKLGRPLRIAVNPIFTDRYRAFTEALFNAWSRAGIQVVAANDDRASYQAAVASGDVNLALMRWAADYDDPDSFTFELLHGRSGYYKHFHSSPELDKLLEEARATRDAAARERVYRRVESLLVDAANPAVVPLFHDVDFRVAHPSVHGLALRAVPPYLGYAELSKVVRAGGQPAVRDRGGVPHVGMAGEVRELDMSRSLTMWERYSGGLLFESLTVEAEGAFVTPFLASEISAEEGARRFRVKLRRGVRFHDGRPLTARDVRWSLERVVRERSSQAELLNVVQGVHDFQAERTEEIAGIEIVGPLELVFHLERSLPIFPAVLAHSACAILPEGTRTLTGTWRDGFAGTGPFRLVRFEPGRSLEVEANPYYWRRGIPAADGLVCVYSMKPEQIAADLREGRLSVGIDFTLSDADRLRSDPTLAPGYREVPSLMTVALFANATEGRPLAREETRRRLFGMDPTVAVHHHLGRLAARAQSYLPPSFLGHVPPQRPRTAPDHSSSAPLELTFAVAPSIRRTTPAFVEEIAGLLASRGARLVSIESETFSAMVKRGEPDLLLGTWWADYPDIDGFLYTSLHSRDGFHGRLVGSPELDTLLESGRQEVDPMVRHGAYRAVEDLLAIRALVLPLYHRNNIVLARPNVRGIDTVIRPTREDYLFEGIWLDE